MILDCWYICISSLRWRIQCSGNAGTIDWQRIDWLYLIFRNNEMSYLTDHEFIFPGIEIQCLAGESWMFNICHTMVRLLCGAWIYSDIWEHWCSRSTTCSKAAITFQWIVCECHKPRFSVWGSMKILKGNALISVCYVHANFTHCPKLNPCQILANVLASSLCSCQINAKSMPDASR
jgi:hypothetical protein